MFTPPLRLTKPGLFITGTDTGVGKTVVTCAIARLMHREGLRVGVCKPAATGCRRDREGLVSEDAEALAHFADCRLPLEVINPIRYAMPLAPAVAAERSGVPFDPSLIAESLRRLDAGHDVLLVEGVGGAMVPLDDRRPQVTVIDLILAIGYPVVVVARAGLGTLNHTGMTVKVLEDRGCRVAGIVINGYPGDPASPEGLKDPSVVDNRAWLTKLTGVPILATIPLCRESDVRPEAARLTGEVIDAVGVTYWPDVLSPPTGA